MSEQYEPKPAIRLIFEYDEDGVRLVSEQPVEMAVAESDQARRDQPSAATTSTLVTRVNRLSLGHG
jgi:hypothetical protein